MKKDIVYHVPGTDLAAILYWFIGDRYYTTVGSLRDLLRISDKHIMSLLEEMKGKFGQPTIDLCISPRRTPRPGEGRTDSSKLGSGNLEMFIVSDRLARVVIEESLKGRQISPSGSGKNSVPFFDLPGISKDDGVTSVITMIRERDKIFMAMLNSTKKKKKR